MIIIAHRLSTIERADRIIVINGGTVIEQGSHVELIQHSDGLYSRLVQRQMLAANLGLVEELSDDTPSCLSPPVSSSLAIPITEHSPDNPDCTVRLSLASLFGSPDSVTSVPQISPKYGSLA